MFEILLIAILAWVAYCIIKPYVISLKDTVIAFTGGLGSGKTFMSVKCSVRCYRGALLGWYLDHVLHPIKVKQFPKPQIYSSIPILLNKKKQRYSYKLTPEILLLQERIHPRSIVFIDEIGSFMNQFEFKAVNAELLDELVRLFRHYTLGGRLICNDQCSENIVLHVRRRLNTVYNLMRWRKLPLLPICWMKCRNISVSEEIKTVINDTHAETEMSTLIALVPLRRMYDTYCYSRRYQRLPEHVPTMFTELKKDDLLKNLGIKLPNKIEIELRRERQQSPPQPPAASPPAAAPLPPAAPTFLPGSVPPPTVSLESDQSKDGKES